MPLAALATLPQEELLWSLEKQVFDKNWKLDGLNLI